MVFLMVSQLGIPYTVIVRISIFGQHRFCFHNAFYVPGVHCFLCFVISLLYLGFVVNFSSSGSDILYHGDVFGRCIMNNCFFVLYLDVFSSNSSFGLVSHFDNDSESVKWHARLGHVHV